MYFRMTYPTPELWSDFDGTAVALVRKTNPRNWIKYPLPALTGYLDFLKGVQSTGIEIGGIVSRRPDIYPRRWATMRSIARLGMASYFGKQVVLTGSETAKGQFVVERSRQTTVGIIEDKPHRLIEVLLSMLSEPEQPLNSILLGIVSHARSQEYLERSLEIAEARTSGVLSVNQFADGSIPASTTSFSLKADAIDLHVVPLGSYSESAGREFGHSLWNLTR